MKEVPSFELFGPAHLTVLFLTVAIPAALILWARGHGKRIQYTAWTLASLLLLNKLATLAYSTTHDLVPWQERLPMQLCDWTTFVAAAALVTRLQLLYELAYFWGLAGTLQATLTPDLPYGFPHPIFFTFNISHSGILASIAFLTLGMGMRPHWSSLVRAWAGLQGYLASTLAVNYLMGTNFGYLMRKPAHASLMDHLGPWPWYILSMEILAAFFFVAYYLPFALADLIGKLRGQGVRISGQES